MEFMTNVRQNTYPTTGDSLGGMVRLNRRGELVTTDYIQQAAIDGRLFVASAGSLTTAITWTATATIDGTKAAIFISVPAGTTILPVSIQLYMEAYGTNAQFECMAACGTGGVSAGGTAVTIQNMRTDAPNTSACTVTSDLTGATYMTTNVSEFWRDGQQFAITKTTAKVDSSIYDPCRFVWNRGDSGACPVIVGAGQLGVFQGSQAGTGFCLVSWIEMPSVSVI
jgi:hypothetical protein